MYIITQITTVTIKNADFFSRLSSVWRNKQTDIIIMNNMHKSWDLLDLVHMEASQPIYKTEPLCEHLANSSFPR